MIVTAIDTNVLVYLLGQTHKTQEAAEKIEHAIQAGGICICTQVLAELHAFFEDRPRLQQALNDLGIVVDPIDEETAFLAGRMFSTYRKKGGPKKRIMGDFLIAAHATIHASGLLTFDQGFFRTHFEGLRIM
jgi:predicted nucleic acid-binding protein